jgi:type IV pilus assembly protein PilC
MATTTYAYKVRDRSGAILEGSLEADDEQLVVAKLREMGYVPVSIAARRRSLLGADLRLGG